MAWGEDGKTLFLTAHTGLYQIHVKTGDMIPSSAMSLNSTVKSN